MSEKTSVKWEVRRRPHSIFWPLMMILAGALLLLNTLNVLPQTTWSSIWRLWPLLFVVGGLDGLYQREGFAGNVIFIGFGVLLLLSNLGMVTASSFGILIRYWPFFIIAWGLDLLIGRRGLLSGLLGVGLGLVVVAALFWLVLSSSAAGLVVQGSNFSQPLQGATSADVNLDLPVGSLKLEGGAAAGELISGVSSLPSNLRLSQDYAVSGGVGSLRVSAVGDTTTFLGFNRQMGLDFTLTKAVPLSLRTHLAIGEQQVDLSGTQVNEAAVEMAIGESTLTLPAEGTLDAKVKVAIGSVVLRVPAGALVQIDTDTGITGISLPAGYSKNGRSIYSPGAEGAADVLRVRVEVPMGSLRIVTLP